MEVIVLNGGSSAGKTSLARRLQLLLPNPWLIFGIDNLVEAIPDEVLDSPGGVGIDDDGRVTPGPVFQDLHRIWLHGLAAMAHAGARIILDEVFLDSAGDQRKCQAAFEGFRILWVGVRCDPDVAAAREVARGDRALGMAVHQADLVHRGVVYDLEVDTTNRSSAECALTIFEHMNVNSESGTG
jgi:chloramphenicol 3-O phosphotransferase